MARVAWIGLGVMGFPMAGHLVKAGEHDIAVYNRSPAKAEAYIGVTADSGAIAETYPQLNAFMYSLDTFTPLISLDQADFWLPNASRGTEISFGIGRVTKPAA